jgi:uncharacterized phage-associated protein
MMTARIDSVCKFICEAGDWRVTNLQLQKILYLAQMLYMGTHDGERLVPAVFEAWDYGPVEPSVYKKVRMFGSSPIEDVFYDARTFSKTDERHAFLTDLCKDLLSLPPSELVAITHWEDGAWAKNYESGVKGIRIPDSDILEEYEKRE